MGPGGRRRRRQRPDNIEELEPANQIDGHRRSDGRHQQGQGDVPKLAPGAHAVNIGGFYIHGRDVLQPRQV